MAFIDKYKKARDKQASMLCIGLDVPAEKEDLASTYLELIEETSDAAAAYKLNTQFMLFRLDSDELEDINLKIHSAGCLSILDHKLSDIGSSNSSALHLAKDSGFDALTISPFPGNIKETVKEAHREMLGTFILTLMSNPEAAWIQKQANVNGKALYEKIAEEAAAAKTDGVVVGATGNASMDDIKKIRKITGEETIFLCPGIGAQGGDLEKILKYAGNNVFINVGRAIIEDKDPKKKADEYRKKITGSL